MSIDEGRYRKGALGIRRTKLEVGDDVSRTDPHWKPFKACRLAMTGNESRRLRHRTRHSYKN